MTLLDYHIDEPVDPASERVVSYLDVVIALTQPAPMLEPIVIVADFDAELRRWLLSQT